MSRLEERIRAAVFVAAMLGMLLVPGHPMPPAGAADSGLVYVFDRVARISGGPATTIMVVAPEATGPAQQAPAGAATIDWKTPAVGTAIALDCGAGADCPPWRAAEAAPNPRLREAGNDTAQFTVYAFDGEGSVVASNADGADLSRFALSPAFRAVPDAWWYLGTDRQPAGTRLIPTTLSPILDACWPAMVGLPIGGVASCDADTLAGHLYVTLRIEDLRA